MLNVANDENGDELNGEADDKNMEVGQMGFGDGTAQVRSFRDPDSQPPTSTKST